MSTGVTPRLPLADPPWVDDCFVRRVRALLRTKPLHDLKTSKPLREGDWSPYDLRGLALAAIDTVIDHMGLEFGATPEQVRERLAELARMAAPDRGRQEAEQVAAAVLEGLLNDRRRREAFAALRARAREQAARAAEYRAAADRFADRRLRLQLPEPGDTDPPPEPTEVVEQRFLALEKAHRAQASDVALHERARLARRQRAELDRRFADLDPEVVSRARGLLGSARGGHAAERALALRDAQRSRDDALAARVHADERLPAAREALAALPAPEPRLLEGMVDGADPTRLVELLDRQSAGAHERAAALRRQAMQERERAVARERRAEQFQHLAELLDAALRPFAGPEPAATAADAGERPDELRPIVLELRNLLERQADRAAQQRRLVTDQVEALRRFARDPRFGALDGPLRDRLTGDPIEAIGTHAGRYVDDLTIRLDQCRATLSELDTHRRLLVREIAGGVQGALWLLRQAEHASTLPTRVRGLVRAALPAYPLRCAEDGRRARRPALDDGRQHGQRGLRPEGLPLLQRATHAACPPRGFSVRILKPNPALRPDRASVSDLATFSGGEQLTAAILLYCTLAQLRAHGRDQRGTAGVLVLDDPIGKSSNVTLLQLQLRVADAMGVQLLYTTAVEDREAVAVLPHWIRLRNDRVDPQDRRPACRGRPQ